MEGFSTLLYGPFTQKVSSKVIQSHFMHIIKVKFAINNPTCSQLLVKKNLEGALFSLLLFRRFAKNNQKFCLLFHLGTVKNQKMLQIRLLCFLMSAFMCGIANILKSHAATKEYFCTVSGTLIFPLPKSKQKF